MFVGSASRLPWSGAPERDVISFSIMALSIMTRNIMTVSIKDLFTTLSKRTHYHYAGSIMLSVLSWMPWHP